MPKQKLFDKHKTYVDIRFGKFRGRYPVYRTLDAWGREWGHTELKPWQEGERGDWVLCDDGHICQVLRRYVLGEGKRPDPTVVIRVPWTSAPYYVRKDGTSISRLTFEPKRWTSPSSMAAPTTPRRGKHWNSKKKHFAWLIVAKGMKPMKAYMLAFRCISRRTAYHESKYLMREDPFMKEVSAIYKELFDANGMTDKDIAREITRMATSDNPSKLKLDALRLALELRGEAPSGTNVNFKFPQLQPAVTATASLASGAAASLKTPPKALQAAQDAIVLGDEPDMQEAEVVATERAELDPDDIDSWRLPNGEIYAKGNPNYLEMQRERSLEKLKWSKCIHKRRKGQTIVSPSRRGPQAP